MGIFSKQIKLITVTLLLLAPAMTIPAYALSSPITEYSVPTASSSPQGITNGPDGALWFTEKASNKIGRVTPSGAMTEYAIPSANSMPQSIVVGSDGALWFTEPGTGKIGRITTSGDILEYSVPTTFTPWDITAGPDGALWFTEGPSDQFGRITTSGSITTYPIVGGDYYGITVGSDGALWLSDMSHNYVDRVTTSGDVVLYALPYSSPTQPFDITAGPDGALWFTEEAAGEIGRLTIPSETPSYAYPERNTLDASDVTTYPVPDCGGGTYSPPTYITAGPDGALWFSVNCSSLDGYLFIDRITTSGDITPFELPTYGGVPNGLTAGPDGALWFTEAGDGNSIGRITPNVAPTLGLITAPTDPVAMNTSISTSASFTDVNPSGTHTAIWYWGDGTTSTGAVSETDGSGNVIGTHTYTQAGVYTVNLTLTDSGGLSATATYQYVVIYNPSTTASLVASGVYNSLAGWDTQNQSTQGQVIYGVSARYTNGALTAQAKMKFRSGNIEFVSSSCQWLAVSGATGTLSCLGALDGNGNYTMLVSGTDGSQTGGDDAVRIKITDNAGSVIYDTQPGASDTTAPTTTPTGTIAVHD